MRPESGLVGIVEHIVVNKKVTALMWYRLMSKHESEWPYGIPKRDGEGGVVVATRSRTPVAITSQAGNQFMKAYRIMTPFWAKEGKGKKRRRKGLCSTQARRVIRSLL